MAKSWIAYRIPLFLGTGQWFRVLISSRSSHGDAPSAQRAPRRRKDRPVRSGLAGHGMRSFHRRRNFMYTQNIIGEIVMTSASAIQCWAP